MRRGVSRVLRRGPAVASNARPQRALVNAVQRPKSRRSPGCSQAHQLREAVAQDRHYTAAKCANSSIC